MFATVISLKYALLTSYNDHAVISINQRIAFDLNNTIKSSLRNSAHYATLYQQNDGRIVAIDTVTSLHPIRVVYARLRVNMTLPTKPELACRIVDSRVEPRPHRQTRDPTYKICYDLS